jgi:hypothetical protein
MSTSYTSPPQAPSWRVAGLLLLTDEAKFSDVNLLRGREKLYPIAGVVNPCTNRN